MPIDDLYGFTGDELEAIRGMIERALRITLHKDRNQYRGIFYSVQDLDGETFILQRNWEPLDNEPMEEQYPDMSVLLYVQNTRRASELELLLTTTTSGQLIRRQPAL